MKKLFLALVLLLVVGCTTQKIINPTVSGYPEGLFIDTKMAVVKNKIIEACSLRGLMIVESSNNQIVCSKTLTGKDDILARIVIGNAYSTQPLIKSRFVLYQSGDDVRVVIYQWLETQMPFGQTKSVELNGVKDINDAQSFLYMLGAE